MNNISPEFSFTSHFIEIRDSVMHYVDVAGHPDYETTFLFLHGNPTSNYLWRNIIPRLATVGRCIAPDLIGFGKSGKPDIHYSFQDHFQFIYEFIQKLDLKNIILVLHDWGGAIGFHYAKLNPGNIKGIVFMETFCKPMEWDELDPVARWLFKKFRDPEKGQTWNGRYNVFLRFILPLSVIRKLSSVEKQRYNEPFKKLEHRKPVIKFPQELPFKGDGSKNEDVAEEYYNWLQQTEIPKLLLYAKPGVQIKSKKVELYKSKFPNLTTKYIGAGKHFIQVDQPENIGNEISKWVTNSVFIVSDL